MLASPALAKKSCHGDGLNKKEKGPFAELNLSQEQRQEIKKIRQERKDEMQKLKAEKLKAKENFHAALNKNEKDSKLKSLHSKMLKTHNKFKTYKFKTLLESRKVLNEDQKKNFSFSKMQSCGKKSH